ncbi:translation elongation factor Ts [Patescibacteria group bacterium]
MAITTDQIKKLRDLTGAGMMDVKEALDESKGDTDAAVEILRKKGAASAVKKSEREANEGWIGQYVHSNGKIGVIVELNCETDFVARNEAFQELAKDLAMQIAATDPLAVSPDDISEEAVEAEKQIALEQLKEEGKPENMLEKIVEGKLDKFRNENSLMKQEYIKDTEKKVEDLISEAVSKLGENISVSRFNRIEIGRD